MNQQTAVVLRSTGSWYNVLTPKGDIIACRLKGKFRTKGIRFTNPIAVGDTVTISPLEKDGTALITAISPRKNYIVRKATNLSKAAHIIASNVDMAYLIVTVVEPNIALGFVDRFLVSAEAHHVPVTLIFNKIDMLKEASHKKLKYLLGIYQAIGYPCHTVTAKDASTLEKLKSEIVDKTVLFSGHSGVGKSTIINNLIPALTLKTATLSDYSGKGKHTTTFAEMFLNPAGGMIIDTPGIKEFGMYSLSKEELSHAFREFRTYMTDCKFYNCTHVHEPNCAIIKKVEEGVIAQERYNNYRMILEDDEMNKEEWLR